MSEIKTTTEKIINFQALKAICALANTLKMGFKKTSSELKIGNSKSVFEFQLNDLEKRMGEVIGFPKIQDQKQKLNQFIDGLNEKTTFGELHTITNECHLIIDEDYWIFSENEFNIYCPR
jgi:hypothetical protein